MIAVRNSVGVAVVPAQKRTGGVGQQGGCLVPAFERPDDFAGAIQMCLEGFTVARGDFHVPADAAPAPRHVHMGKRHNAGDDVVIGMFFKDKFQRFYPGEHWSIAWGGAVQQGMFDRQHRVRAGAESHQIGYGHATGCQHAVPVGDGNQPRQPLPIFLTYEAQSLVLVAVTGAVLQRWVGAGDGEFAERLCVAIGQRRGWAGLAGCARA